MHNVFACLVHENRACVIDLVRNLRCLDPSSTVLLYDGGGDPELLTRGFPFARLGAVVHPQPRRMTWGRLHDFALDCMRFALQHLAFDALTIVDSDQLAVRPGYSDYLAAFLRDRPRVGVLGSDPRRQRADTDIPPAASAVREIDLWRPFLRRFPDGEQKWAYWTFWPSTVFTAAAARDLTRLADSDAQLRGLLARTAIWATEESLLPTLTALLGYEVAANPCRYDYVRFRVTYPLEYIDGAATRPDVFWVHPVPRRYDDPARARIRARFHQYRRAEPAMPNNPAAPTLHEPGLPTLALLARMKIVDGWFSDEEAVLLAAAAAHALRELPGSPAIVEVGSYCGRCTIVLAEAARAVDPQARVFAVDPHEGVVGALDQGLHRGAPTFDRFRRNVEEAGLSAVVEPIRAASHEVPWERPVGLLFIDGLHDYPSVAADFHHFEAHVLPGGYAAFHDYADYYPGVQTFVDELLAGGAYRLVGRAGSLVVVRKDAPAPAAGEGPIRPEAAPDTVWLYWEGAMPAYISLCCKSVFAHNRNVKMLDPTAFDALFHEDRDVPLERLVVEHRADFIRAYLLHHYGGLWVDTDCVVLQSLRPLLAAAREHGFAGYRDASGSLSGNLMATVPRGELIAEHYREVCRLIRSGRPLDWLDTTCVSLDRAAALLPGKFFLATTDRIMPICWSQSERLCAVADAAGHEALVRPDAYCYMLFHNTIKGRRKTRLLCCLSEEELLAGPWFLSHLLRKALGVRAEPGPIPAGDPDGPTHFDEGAFDYLAARFGVRSMVDVGCGPGGMVYYARSRGVKALGVAAAGAARGHPGLVEHDYALGPLFLGDFDLGWSVDFACRDGGRWLPNCLATFRGCRVVFVTAPGPTAGDGGAETSWAPRFAEAGFALDAGATERVREQSTMESSYTREGGLVFVRAGRG